jgi:hypothetical protein
MSETYQTYSAFLINIDTAVTSLQRQGRGCKERFLLQQSPHLGPVFPEQILGER